MEAYGQLKKGLALFMTLLDMGRVRVTLEERASLTQALEGGQDWSAGAAFSIARILNRHAGELGRAGFNVDTIPPVTVSVQSRPLSGPLGGVIGKPAPKVRTVGYNGENFEVSFEYNAALNEAIKAIPGKNYHADRRVWLLPVSAAHALKTFAHENGFMVTEPAARLMHSVLENYEASYAADGEPLGLNLKKEPYRFQNAGIRYAIKNRRAIIADQMGLGKTLQAIGAVVGADLFPCLVICPKSLRYTWKSEWEECTSKKAHLYSPNLRDHLGYYVGHGYVDVAITHYEGMKKYLLAEYRKAPGGSPATIIAHKSLALFKSVIIDEAHEFRNPVTERFGIARVVTQGKAMVLLLTGTPVVNTVADLGALLELTGMAASFGGLAKFRHHYADISVGLYSDAYATVRGAAGRKLADLNVKLRATCFIRREKHQVLKELPDKLRQIIRVDLDNMERYKAAELNLYAYLNQWEGKEIPLHGGVQAEMLARIGVLKKVSAEGKMYAIFDLIHTILASGEKVGVFCWHLATVALIASHYPQSVCITGNESDEEVEANKKAFMTNPATNVIIITYKRGGVGHTLTAASKVIMAEFGWNHKDQDQAEDRFHRIGAKDTVNAYYMIGRHTVDEYLNEIINAKRATASAATGGTETVSTEAGMVSQIIRRLKGGTLNK